MDNKSNCVECKLSNCKCPYIYSTIPINNKGICVSFTTYKYKLITKIRKFFLGI